MSNWNMWDDPRYSDPNWTPPDWNSGPQQASPTDAAQPASWWSDLTNKLVRDYVKEPTGEPVLTEGQQSIWDTIRTTFNQYGLDTPDVLAWAKQQIVNNASAAAIVLDLYDPTTVPGKVVDQLYPELALRRADPHLEAWSIQTAQQYRAGIQQLESQYLPAGFVKDENIVNLAVGNTSLNEAKDRIMLAAQYANQAPEARNEFDRLYGTTMADHTGYWLDPAKTEQVLSQRLAAAELSGTGVESGYGRLSRAEAERYQQLGLSPGQASQGFGELVRDRQLFGVLPGEQGAGVGRRAQLEAALGGDAAAQQQIARVQAARRAVFGDGGGYASGQAGITGIGRAAS